MSVYLIDDSFHDHNKFNDPITFSSNGPCCIDPVDNGANEPGDPITVDNPFEDTLSVQNLLTGQDPNNQLDLNQFAVSTLNSILDLNSDTQNISATSLLTTISNDLQVDGIKANALYNQAGSTFIDLTDPTDINISATSLTFNGSDIATTDNVVTNPMTIDLDGGTKNLINFGRASFRGAPFIGPPINLINGGVTYENVFGTANNVFCNYAGGIDNGIFIYTNHIYAYDDANISHMVGQDSYKATQNHIVGAQGVDYILHTTLQDTATRIERFRIGSDNITYIIGGLDVSNNFNMNGEIDMNLNNIINMGQYNVNMTDFVFNTETSLSNLQGDVGTLENKTQNIDASTGNTIVNGSMVNMLGITDSFAVTDDTVGQFQLLKFSVTNTSILSQISHVFSAGLTPVSNLVGSIGTTLKRFSNLWIDKINNLTPVGGVYTGLSDGPLVSGGTSGSLLPLSGSGSLTILANTFKIGDSYHMEIAGDIPIGDKDDVITITINQNGIQLAQISVDMEDSTNTFFELETDMQIRSIGATGQIITNIDFTFNKNLLKNFKGSRHIQLSNIDTTIDTTLSVNAIFAGQLNSQIQTRLFYLRQQY